jgi:hypothetical protein
LKSLFQTKKQKKFKLLEMLSLSLKPTPKKG